MLKILILIFLFALVANANYYEELSEKLIPDIEAKNPKWKPGLNPYFQGKSKEYMAKLMGFKKITVENSTVLKSNPQISPYIPGSFDARTQWSYCPSISVIKDQSSCGSCWAVSSASAQSDRMCIGYNGEYNVYLSEEDILSCCTFCGSGCDGGTPLMAWKYWVTKGVVSGGPYGSYQGCQPYEIPPCGYGGCQTESDTPKCVKKCEPSYGYPYKKDKNFGSSYYSIDNGASGMQQELYNNGPLVSGFDVYEDFYYYTSGVYHHVSGAFVGGHAVRVIGWGTENGSPYWLVANSWSNTWGINGYFKILRGNNECEFETDISAGLA